MTNKNSAPAQQYVSFFVGEMVTKQDPRENLYWRAEKALRKALVHEVMGLCGFNQLEAAKMLGVNRNTLRKWIAESGIKLEVTDV